MRNHTSMHLVAAAGFLALGLFLAPAEAQGPPDILWQQQSHAGELSGLAFSPLGDRISTGSAAETGIRHWNPADGSPTGSIASYGPVLAYSADGRLLATAVNLVIYIYHADSGELYEKIQESNGWPPIITLAFSPDGQYLAASDYGKTKLFSVATGEVVHEFNFYSRSVAFSPDGRLLAGGGQNGFTRLWSVADGRLLRLLGYGDWHEVQSLAFSPDGQVLASGGGNDYYKRPGTIKWWRVADGVKIRETTDAHTALISSIAYSPDGKLLISGAANGTLRAWNTTDGSLLRQYDQETGPGRLSVAFAPDGRAFAYGRSDGQVVLARNPRSVQFRKGDLDCDGSVNFADINPFVVALGGREAYEQKYPNCDWLNADCNEDGGVNFADIGPFVGLLGR